MNFKLLFLIGSILTFLGLFWMLLPHAFHDKIIENQHIIHIIQGLIPTLLGLIMMVNSENKLKYLSKNKNFK